MVEIPIKWHAMPSTPADVANADTSSTPSSAAFVPSRRSLQAVQVLSGRLWAARRKPLSVGLASDTAVTRLGHVNGSRRCRQCGRDAS